MTAPQARSVGRVAYLAVGLWFAFCWVAVGAAEWYAGASACPASGVATNRLYLEASYTPLAVRVTCVSGATTTITSLRYRDAETPGPAIP